MAITSPGTPNMSDDTPDSVGDSVGSQLTPDAGVRDRLVQRLDAVHRGQVVILAGPPGYAKSELVSSWLERHADLHAVPISEPVSRDDLRERIAEALSQASPNDLAVLVVSGEQLAGDADAMAPMVEASAAPTVRLVVTSRQRPNIPLGALAARGRLIDIDAQELAYTDEEVAERLRAHGRDASPEAVEQIRLLAAGWPVVVDMVVTMNVSLDQPERLHRLMDSYIADRIAADLDDADIRLLSDLSVVRRLDPQTASMLSGRADAAAQLSRLQSRGVPIAWNSRNTIEINPALSGYFRRRLLLTDPERATQLMGKAAAWLRTNDRIIEAVQLAVDARNFSLGWMVLGEYVISNFHTERLRRELPQAMALLPDGWEAQLILNIATGNTSPETLLSHLHGIDASNMLDLPTVGGASYALFFIGMMRRAGYPQLPAYNALFDRAASITEDEVGDLQRCAYAALQCEYGLWLLHDNQLDEARTRLLDGIGLARLVKTQWAVVLCLGGLATLHALQGNRETAMQLIKESLAAYAETEFDGSALDEYARLAQGILGLDDPEGPQRDERMIQVAASPQRMIELDGIRAALLSLALLNMGDSRGALRLISAYRDEPRSVLPAGDQLVISSAAVLANTQAGDLAAARKELAVLDEVDLHSSPEWREVLAAHVAVASGEPERAREILRDFVRDTSRVDSRMTLSILGIYSVASSMVRDDAAAADATERARVLARRLGMGHVGARFVSFSAAANHDVDLTEAERKVLENLNVERTLGETAEAMYISQNTLKTHLRRIYRKLGVRGREEAIERARALGITRAN